MKSKFRTQYAHRRVAISFKDVNSMTDPQFKDECSIDGIVRRYGILPSPSVPAIGADVSDIGDFEECMRRVQDGLDHFISLPSDIRARFGNDPKAFFSWINDPSNIEEACKVGLMVRRVEEKSIGERLDTIADKLDKAVTPKGEISA